MPQRRYDIDWLRVLAVLVLFPFHTAMIFAPWDFHIKNDELSLLSGVFTAFVHQWHMPIFFLISGAATWFSLGKKGGGRYVTDRVRRLLVSLVFGMLVIVPHQVYCERLQDGTFTGSHLEFFPLHIFDGGPYPDGNFSWHHLWFLAYLFLYSVVALPLFFWFRKGGGASYIERFSAFCKKPGAIFILFIPIAAEQVMLTPFWPPNHHLVGDWMLHAVYFTFFVYGYIMASDDRITESINRHGPAAVGIGLLTMAAVLLIRFLKSPGEETPGLWVIHTTLMSLNSWLWIVGFLWLSNNFLNRKSIFLSYANEAALPVYVLHQTAIVVIGFFVVRYAFGVGIKFALICVSSFIVTIIIYDLVVKRFNPIRILFGMRPKKTGRKDL